MHHHFLNSSDKIAIYAGENEISYAQLIRRVEAYAGQLEIKPGERAAIFAENCVEWIYAFYAVWAAGGIAVLFDFAASDKELAHMLQDSQPKIVITSGEGAVRLKNTDTGFNGRVVCFNGFQQSTTHPLQPVERDFDETAVIMYTSGTTGLPKGVMLSYNALRFNIKGVLDSGMLIEKDRALVLFPFHHIVPLQGHLLCPLFVGASIVFISELSGEVIMDAFVKYHITILNGVPRLYERFHQKIFGKIRSNPAGRILLLLARIFPFHALRRFLFSRVHKAFGGSIRFLLSGGAPLPKKLADDFWRIGFRMIEGYGLTEMGPLISYNTPQAWRTGSVGRPISGVDVRIVDGEVVARSPGMMQGYLNDTAATDKILVDGWIHTGDTGYFDKDNFLVLTGRKNDMLVLANGKNVYAEEIEQQLSAVYPQLGEIALTLRAGKLFAVIHPDLNLFAEQGVKNIREAIKWEILDRYNSQVPLYKKILDFTVINQTFPRTRLGKLRRYQLNTMLETPPRKKDEKAQNDNESTRLLVSYLSKECQQPVAIHSHLEMDLALDSLALIDLKIYIENTFGIPVSDSLFIEHPRVADLVEFIERNKTGVDTNAAGLADRLRNIKPVNTRRGGLSFYLLRLLFSPAMLIYIRLKRQGVAQLRELNRLGKNFILAVNHQSFLDPFLLAHAIPVGVLRNTFFLAKGKHFQFPLGRLIGRGLNSVILDVNQNSETTIGKLVSLLKAGKNVVIFPEGTRSYTGELGRFSNTFALLSKELAIPVFPVGIKGAFDLLPRSSRLPRPGRVEVTVFSSIDPLEKDVEQISGTVFSQINNYIEAE